MICTHGLNKGCSLKFHVASQIQQKIPESQRTHWMKCCEYKKKDENNSPNILNDKHINEPYFF